MLVYTKLNGANFNTLMSVLCKEISMNMTLQLSKNAGEEINFG
jgi:hypothetical protein